MKRKAMAILSIKLPDDIRNALSIGEEELADLALEALLVKLYSRGELSSGKASELLQVSRRQFLELLDQYGVSTFDEDVDFAAEARYGRA
jgi:predicted HTH domain antitoxin